MFRSKLGLGFGFLAIVSVFVTVESKCQKGCPLALGSYNVWAKSNLTFIANVTNNSIQDILSYNAEAIPNQDLITTDTRINIPFTCDCIGGNFLGHVFEYKVISGDTYDTVATKYYANLTTVAWLQRFNSYPANNSQLNVTVNCSCGDSSVSKDYGLFITYPLRPGESLESIASQQNLSASLLRRYNPGANFSAGSGLVYIPGKGILLVRNIDVGLTIERRRKK